MTRPDRSFRRPIGQPEIAGLEVCAACHDGHVGSPGHDPLVRLRRVCLSFPDVTERLSHGAPAFFVRDKKTFVNAWIDGHHADTFPHLWCAAARGAQEALVRAQPEKFFRPPYVGHRGWIGVRLDGEVEWDEVAELCEGAYRTVAPPRLVAVLDTDRS